MKTAEDIVRALAQHAPCRHAEDYCAFPQCGTASSADEVDDHVPECPYRMAVEWVGEREAIRADLRQKGWTLRSDGYWSANETGPLDARGMIWQDRMIDLDPENSRRILAAIEARTPPRVRWPTSC